MRWDCGWGEKGLEMGMGRVLEEGGYRVGEKLRMGLGCGGVDGLAKKDFMMK